MPALGHKRTNAAHRGMSALPPKATEIADSRKRSRPLYPRKRTCAAHKLMSALGQYRTCAVQEVRPHELCECYLTHYVSAEAAPPRSASRSLTETSRNS